MDFEGLFKILAQKFSESSIRYALIGGFALHAAGYARATGDIDFLIHAEDAPKAKDILLPLGYRVVHESKDVLNLLSPWGLIGGIDFIKAHRSYALKMLDRARPYSANAGVNLPAVSKEDLIGLKVQAMANDPSRRTRDLADVEWLIRHSEGKLDMQLVEEYFEIFSLKAELSRILAQGKNV